MNPTNDPSREPEPLANFILGMKGAVNAMKPLQRRFLAFFLATSAAVGLGWISTATEEWVRGNSTNTTPRIFFLGSTLFIFGSSLVYSLRRNLFGTRVVRLPEPIPANARACLILFVSRERRMAPPRSRLVRSHPNGPFQVLGRVLADKNSSEIHDDQIQLSGRIAKDIQELDCLEKELWPWQQILRAVQLHTDKLERIWLIGSTGENGSGVELGLCAEWLRTYPEIKAEIKAPQLGETDPYFEADFENYKSLLKRLQTIIHDEHLISKSERDDRIVIDVTGGQKPTSIAAAAVTLNSDAVFQYIQTNPPKEPILYDITYDNPLFSDE